MSEQTTEFLRGHFLMAMPLLADPNFRRSVTCISEHTVEGAVGIVVNQVDDELNGGIIFEELGIKISCDAKRIPIFIGGPVHHNEIFILHGSPLHWHESFVIGEDLALSNSREILEAIALGKGPQHFIICLGCAGWGPGQLEWEIRQNAWLTSLCSHDIIFQTPIDERWETAIKRLGIEPELLSNLAGNA
ncbi:MAG: YqgE/AlgH family protein [Desulfobacteraceae bacterium]|nr:YqgE/AlgH family protein [Desulfobacteraceae bacterium]